MCSHHTGTMSRLTIDCETTTVSPHGPRCSTSTGTMTRASAEALVATMADSSSEALSDIDGTGHSTVSRGTRHGAPEAGIPYRFPLG